MTDATDPAVLSRFLLGLAEGMNASAESVDRIRDTMVTVSKAYGVDDADFVVLPTVLLVQTGSVERGRVALRSTQLTFLPAFWLLVPCAAGLIAITEAVGTDAGFIDFAAALVTVMSIALGVLIGTALYRAVTRGAEEIVQFAVAMPTPEIRMPRLGAWARVKGWWGRNRDARGE